VSRADVLALGASATALAVCMHVVAASRPSSLLVPVAFGPPIVLLACMVTANDAPAEVLGAVTALTALSGLLGLVVRMDAREPEVRVRWRQFELAFRRYVAETSDPPES
jgi:hypothetical protein